MWKLNSLVRLNPAMIYKLETFQMNNLKNKYITTEKYKHTEYRKVKA